MSTINSSVAPLWLTEQDLQSMNDGQNYRMYERLGSHLRTVDGVTGVNFSVWAPNAQSVSVVGDFNDWNADNDIMQKHSDGGYWEKFVPELHEGQLYKYVVTTYTGEQVLKSDPCGFEFELPPKTASIITSLDGFKWSDDQWMNRRREVDQLNQPMSIYELHLGSWHQDSNLENGWINYRDLAAQIVDYCHEMNFTHIELLPVSEHPYTGSWGYQTVGYFGVTSRFGTPKDFMYFVDLCHQNDIGVIIDWVPAHFPKDKHGLARFDGTALYEHADPRQGEHPDWGTLIFNYGRNEVRNFLISNALFWLDKYHIDGLRVDAVASMLYLDYSREEGQWIPNKYGGRENLEAIEFLKDFNNAAHREHPGVLTIAEESTAWGGVSRSTESGGLGFSMKWNMGWMNDSLNFIRNDPVFRKFHHDQLTFSLVYAFSENFVLPLSHDEVVHGKGALIDQMPGDIWQKFANMRLLYSYMWTHPGKKLLFMGNEFGQWHEWNCNTSIQWELLKWENHNGLKSMVTDLNLLLRTEPALYEMDFQQGGFEWIDCNDHTSSTISFIRRGKKPEDYLVVCCNFTPVIRQNYSIDVPEAGNYREIFNSDSEYYGGSNNGNGLGRVATRIESEDPNEKHRYKIEITVPPLGVTILKRESGETPSLEKESVQIASKRVGDSKTQNVEDNNFPNNKAPKSQKQN